MWIRMFWDWSFFRNSNQKARVENEFWEISETVLKNSFWYQRNLKRGLPLINTGSSLIFNKYLNILDDWRFNLMVILTRTKTEEFSESHKNWFRFQNFFYLKRWIYWTEKCRPWPPTTLRCNQDEINVFLVLVIKYDKRESLEAQTISGFDLKCLTKYFKLILLSIPNEKSVRKLWKAAIILISFSKSTKAPFPLCLSLELII